jgi:hypothetical protein
LGRNYGVNYGKVKLRGKLRDKLRKLRDTHIGTPYWYPWYRKLRRKLRDTHIGTRGTERWVSRGSEVGVPWFRLVFRGSA